MGSFHSSKTASFLLLLLFLTSLEICFGSRKLSSLYQPPPTTLIYHKGALLQGDIPISIVWYGKFTPAQKSIILDFLLSLTPHHEMQFSSSPSVSKWWATVDSYVEMARKKKTHILLANQVSDDDYSIGKSLDKSHVSELAARSSRIRGGVVLVLTAQDVAVEGFCMSHCGFHTSHAGTNSAYIWVGNSVSQCPGQCAWPFHRPVYGPQGPPLVAPNNDVGLDGMIVNIGTLLAGTVTNPVGTGYYQGESGAGLEVGSVCQGVYGKGAYPGYAGEVLVDPVTGASYNVKGVTGRKYLVPALFDPSISACSVPMV